jgi:Ti-type conjugative transfer relaxase TraA
MVSIGKVGGGPGAERYYTDAVARGQEDYYAGSGEAPGEWYGSGAAAVGLSGQVDGDEFSSLFRGVAPSGQRLRREPDERSVIGFDLTFGAPKSVSILYGIGDEAVSRAAREAHDEAVRQALGYLESSACFTRRGHGGAEQVRGDGLIVGLFRHRTSRAGDPHLHTHAVVANSTCAAGRWSTLDGRAIYAHARTAGFLYQAALRDELTGRLGVEWTPVERGVADIRGMDPELLGQLSRRRTEIRDVMARLGQHSARAAQVAALETRRSKKHDVPVDRLRADWCARAAEHGFGRRELADVLGRSAAERREVAAPSDPALASPEGVTREASTFDRRTVLREWAEAHPAGAPVSRIEALADAWLASDDAVQLEPATNASLGPRYSTPDMLATERDLIQSGERRRREGAGLASKQDVLAVLDDRPLLAGEQAAMVEHLTRSGDGLQVVRAAAGTGKTYALEAARHVWERSGHRVYGCALSARAAVELETQAGIDSTTIARLKLDFDRGYGLSAENVLVVDEAGMVGSRDLERLAAEAEGVGAKLVLVGDDRQLPEIDAGGAFRGLAERLGACELHETRRQQHAWDRDALAALRVGGIDEWASRYRDAGRIVARATAEEARRDLVTDWWQAARQDDRDAVMVAHRRSDVADLNRRARARMQQDGRLGSEHLAVGDRTFARGDRILARSNDRRTGLVNGARGDVVGVDPEHRTLTVRLRSGTDVVVPSGYLDAGHLDHGYALTAHAAQGATVDNAFVLGSDDLYQEWGYTALTRHRDESRFYMVSPASTERALPGLEEELEDPILEELREMLGSSRQKSLAIELATDHPDVDTEVLARYRAIRAEQIRIDERRAAIEAAVEETRARQTSLEAERAALSRLQRRRADELERQIDVQRAAVGEWSSREAELRERSETVRARREAWLAEHRPELQGAAHRLDDAISRDHDDVRAGLAAQTAGRPLGLAGREEWAGQAVERAHVRARGDRHLPHLPETGLDLDFEG